MSRKALIKYVFENHVINGRPVIKKNDNSKTTTKLHSIRKIDKPGKKYWQMVEYNAQDDRRACGRHGKIVQGFDLSGLLQRIPLGIWGCSIASICVTDRLLWWRRTKEERHTNILRELIWVVKKPLVADSLASIGRCWDLFEQKFISWAWRCSKIWAEERLTWSTHTTNNQPAFKLTKNRHPLCKILNNTPNKQDENARNVAGKSQSTSWMSFEKRLMIRPRGVWSKNSIGARSIRFRRKSCVTRAACKVPT